MYLCFCDVVSDSFMPKCDQRFRLTDLDELFQLDAAELQQIYNSWKTKEAYLLAKHFNATPHCAACFYSSEQSSGNFIAKVYLLTYLLTYSMEQSPSWEANQ